MNTVKYIIKRVLLMFLTLFIIMTMLFCLVRLLPFPLTKEPGSESYLAELAWRKAWGYDKPLIVQYGIYLKNVLLHFDWGISTECYFNQSVTKIVNQKLPYTIIVNLYSIIIAMPIGLLLGAYAAFKKNKWQDQVISVGTMVLISIPSYVYAFLIQYFLCYKLGLPMIVEALNPDKGITLFSWKMFVSMIPPVLALGFGIIAGFTRTTRAELTEVLTGEYMLLARSKGLTRWQATLTHGFRNAMVIILPMIFGEFISILGGSLIIEKVFAIPGIGDVYLKAINNHDYNLFMYESIFYLIIGLVAGIVVDISYGLIDPRIRMGGGKTNA